MIGWGPQASMDGEARSRKGPRDPPGAGFHRQSGNIGLGVILRGEVKRVSRATIEKSSAPQAVREPGLKGPQSRRLDLKPLDLGLVKAKRGESPVEA